MILKAIKPIRMSHRESSSSGEGKRMLRGEVVEEEIEITDVFSRNPPISVEPLAGA
jgi:hypothetical protein